MSETPDVANNSRPTDSRIKLSRSEWGGLLTSGVGIGWLCGMTTSPVIQGVITALLATVLALAGAMVGLRDNEAKDKSRLDPRPMSYVVIGLVLGCSLGLETRSHDWLSLQPAPPLNADQAMAKWKKLGLSKTYIAQRLFEDERIGDNKAQSPLPFLFNKEEMPSEACEHYKGLQGEELRQTIIEYGDTRSRNFAQKCKSLQDLKTFIGEYACPAQ